ncbi:MAG: hypothetical protein JRJ23_09740 [Deltaproteobacteria bacterium]|nr:hypothetical protein [Deltaproteobacteria bacterium]
MAERISKIKGGRLEYKSGKLYLIIDNKQIKNSEKPFEVQFDKEWIEAILDYPNDVKRLNNIRWGKLKILRKIKCRIKGKNRKKIRLPKYSAYFILNAVKDYKKNCMEKD